MTPKMSLKLQKVLANYKSKTTDSTILVGREITVTQKPFIEANTLAARSVLTNLIDLASAPRSSKIIKEIECD